MGILRRNRAFVVTAACILVVGAALFGSVVAVRVLAAGATTPAAPLPTPTSYNVADSYGITGYAPLTIVPTAETPAFIKQRLDEKRGIVLLVYCQGAADDMEMLSYFKGIKAQYANDTSFFDFEARASSDLGDTLQLLHVSDPPILAIIRGNGQVAEMYTGWIGEKVMEQQVADAVRGL